MAGTEALYAEDAYLREFEAIVIGVKPDVAGVALDRTALTNPPPNPASALTLVTP